MIDSPMVDPRPYWSYALKLKLKQKLTLFASRNSGIKRASIAATLTWMLNELKSWKHETKTLPFFSIARKTMHASYVLLFSFHLYKKSIAQMRNSHRLEYKFSIQIQYDLLPCWLARCYVCDFFFHFGYVFIWLLSHLGCVLAQTLLVSVTLWIRIESAQN